MRRTYNHILAATQIELRGVIVDPQTCGLAGAALTQEECGALVVAPHPATDYRDLAGIDEPEIGAMERIYPEGRPLRERDGRCD